MKMHKKHIISLVTLACLAASSSVLGLISGAEEPVKDAHRKNLRN